MPLGRMKGMSSERRGKVGTQQGIADQDAAALRSRKEEVIQDNS